MTANLQSTSAKILQFRVKTRVASEHPREQPGEVVKLLPQRLPVVDFGSGWYHDAAIQDAERTAKR